MVRLLRTNFARLWKTTSFWVCFILSAGMCLASFLLNCFEQSEYVQLLGAEMLSWGSNVQFFAAIFTALYLGTDYSNGTIRNKLVIGHTRLDIYFSNLITAAAWDLIVLCGTWLAILIAGLFLGGQIGMPADELAVKILISIAAAISISAIHTLLGMLITSKSIITTITIVSVIVMIMGATVSMSLLAEPEYMTEYTMTADGGGMIEKVPNPHYVSGVKRDIITAVYDILPSGQIMQLAVGNAHNPELMPLYSLGVFAVTTAAGALIFRRKDLK